MGRLNKRDKELVEKAQAELLFKLWNKGHISDTICALNMPDSYHIKDFKLLPKEVPYIKCKHEGCLNPATPGRKECTTCKNRLRRERYLSRGRS